MTRQDMIDKIYEVVADKSMTYWCIFKTRYNKPWDYSQLDFMTNSTPKIGRINDNWSIETVEWMFDSVNLFIECRWSDSYNLNNYWQKYKYIWYKIIWHPVMIWDILDYLSSNDNAYYDLQLAIVRERTFKRKPIEDQSEECILFIYNLIND